MASYTRQSSFSDGDTITAALFNNEYNQLLNAFAYASSSTTGHRHDGTTAEGGNIHTIGDQDFLNKIVADSTNNRWGVFVQVSSSAVEQIRISDGVISPVTDNDIDLGTSSLEFKDAYFDGTVTTDALVADTADINGGTVDGATIGASSATTGVFTTIQGSTITATTAFVPDASDGASLGTSTLEFSDIFLADGAIIKFGDQQEVLLTHVHDTGLLLNSTMQLQFGDSGTYIHQSADGVLDLVSDTEIELTATTIDINGAVAMDGAITGGTNITISGELDAATLDISGNADIDGTTNLDAVDIDGAVQIDATVTVGVDDTGYDVKFFGDTASAYMLWDTSADDLILGGAARVVVPASGLVIGSTAVTSTGAELNILDGVTSTAAELNIMDGDTAASSTTLADADRVVVNDAGTMKQVALTDFETYFESSIDTFSTIDINGGSIDGATLGTNSAITQAVIDDIDLNGKVITMTGSSSDTAVFTAGTNGTLSIVTTDAAAAAANIQITADGTVDIDSAGVLTLDSGAAINIEPASGSAILLDGTISIDAGVVTGATSVTSTAFVGALTGNVTGNASGTAATVTTAAQSNITSLGTLTTLTVDNVIINGSTIGHTGDTDLITVASGIATVAGEVSMTTLDIGGTNVTSTAAELNILDGVTSTAAELNILDGVTSTAAELNALDGITAVVGELNALDIGATAIGTAVASKAVILDSNKDYTGIRNLTISGELDAATLDISGAIDVAGTTNLDVVDIDGAVDMASTLAVAGVVTANAGVVVDNITIDGTTIALSSGDLLLDVAGDIVLDADGTDITFKDGGTTFGKIGQLNNDLYIGTNNTTLSFIDGQRTINPTGTNGAQASDLISLGDANNRFKNLFLSGNLDVDGTANLDAVDIDGAVQADATITVGVDDTGYDVKFFGATSGSHLLWDESADDLKLVGAAGLTVAGDISSTTAGTSNFRAGVNAGDSIASGGNYNVCVGDEAGTAITTGDDNVAVGYAALDANSTGSNNIAIGSAALGANTTAHNNVAVGYNALDANLTGTQNIAVGYQALSANTTANSNIAVGTNALAANTTGDTNTAAGENVMAANIEGSKNSAFGYIALDADTYGNQSTAIGYGTLSAQNFTSSTASQNTAVGYQAGTAVTTGIQNTLIGAHAGDALTDADNNVAVGYQALSTDTLGSRSTALGRFALYTQNSTSATNSNNVGVGYYAGKAVTTGVNNTLLGTAAHDNLTTGDLNTAIGYNLAPSAVDVDSEIVIGSSITGAGTNTVRIGTGGGTATLALDGSADTWIAVSDARLKKDVADSTAGLSFINDLRPVTFKWNAKNEIAEDLPQYDADSSDPVQGAGKAYHGFIAQEVKAVIDNHVDVVEGNGIWHEDPDGTQMLGKGDLVPMLVKAVQELSAKIAELEAKPRCKCNGE